MAGKGKNNKIVFDTLRRVNFVSKLFLMSPYTIADDNTLHINNKLSWFEFLLSMVTIISELGLQVYTRPTLQGNPYLLLANIRSILNVIFSMLTCIEMKFKHECIRQIFEGIKDIQSSVKLTDQQQRAYSKKITRFLVGFFLIVVFANVIIIQKSYDVWLWWIVFMFHVTRLVSQPIIMEIQFVTLIALVWQYIDWIQNNLKTKLNHEASYNAVASDELFVVKKAVEELNHKWTARKVEELRQLYGRMNDLKFQINEAFSFRIWLFILYAFVEFVFYIFLNVLLLQFWNKHQSDFFSIRLIWLHVWVAYIFWQFIQIVTICEATADKGRGMGILIHQLYSASFAKNIREELSAFSLELLHRNPSITACNFFNVDYPLVSSVLGSSVMHIIILLQFRFPDYDDGLQPIQDLLSRS